MKRIIIVEPDRELSLSLQTFLTHEGYAVQACFDGEEALRLCDPDPPDIVLMEGLLPKVGGFELAKKIRELPNGGLVSILLVSAIFSAAKYRPQVRGAQIDEVLAKPFTQQDLLAKIESMAVKLETRTKPGSLPPDAAFPLSGTLTQTPFIRLVFQLYRTKASGTLRLQNETTKKLVTFENGEPRFVVSNMEQECLGQILVKKGRLSPEECKHSLETMAQLQKRQGETLIQMGLLEPYELEEALKFQAREKFCEIFTWRDGQYLFVPGRVFKKDLTPVDLSLPQLCLRGVKEHYNISTLQVELTPFASAPAVIREKGVFQLEDFKFATWDMRIVQQIRRGKTIDEVLATRVARDVDVYQLFFTLYMLDGIGFQESFEPSQPKFKPKPAIVPSPFELLGVSATASTDEVKKAFAQKKSQLKGSKEPAHNAKALQEAYDQLATQQGRHDYLLRTYEQEGKLPEGAEDVLQSEELLEIGKKFLEKKNAQRARRVFQDGANWFPEEGRLLSYFGFCMFRDAITSDPPDPRERDRALKMLIKGAKMAAESEEAHFLLGRAFLLDKQYENAILELQKTLDLKPRHPDAAAELHVARMRLEKQKTTPFMRWKK